MFDISCEYALRCSGYICTKACNKRYCGIYRKLKNADCTVNDIGNKIFIIVY